MNRTARGWALAEAALAVALSAVVAAAALGGLVDLQRRAAGEAERVAMASGLRTAAQVLHAELASVDAADGDLISAAADGVTYRAIRSTGTGCGLAVDGVIVRTSTWRSLRLPVPGRDSLVALEDNGAWRIGPLTGPPRGATCADGAPAMVLPTSMLVPLGGATVLRTFEVMELRVYTSSGDRWLGMRSVSAGEAIQPVAGPFQVVPATFSFLDGAGVPTAGLAGVRQVRARFVGVTRTEAAAGAGSRADILRRDSLMTVVPLRGGSPP